MYKILQQGDKAASDYRQFAVDTEADLTDIPTYSLTLGDTAIAVDSGEVYMYNSAGKWVKL